MNLSLLKFVINFISNFNDIEILTHIFFDNLNHSKLL